MPNLIKIISLLLALVVALIVAWYVVKFVFWTALVIAACATAYMVLKKKPGSQSVRGDYFRKRD